MSVLDGVLAKEKYLVRDKVTIADLAFIPWSKLFHMAMKGEEYDFSKYVQFNRWNDEISFRESVAKAYAKKPGA